MSLAGCCSLEVSHTDLVLWRLGLQSPEVSTGLDVQDGPGWQLMPAVGPPTLDWTGPPTLSLSMWLGLLRVWWLVPKESILRVSIPREQGGSWKVS